MLAQRQIPLILNTSKTAAEVRILHKQLALTTPYIVENGAAVIFPDDRADKVFGVPRGAIVSCLQEIRAADDYRFTAFSELSAAAIADLTGLAEADAALASKRSWTEPLLWQDSDQRLKDLALQLEARGLTCTKGGRFVHVAGSGNKGEAMRWLAQRYWPEASIIALGDGHNDIPMLELADHPVVVRSAVHAPLEIHNPHCIVTAEVGPTGWNETLLSLLSLQAGDQ